MIRNIPSKAFAVRNKVTGEWYTGRRSLSSDPARAKLYKNIGHAKNAIIYHAHTLYQRGMWLKTDMEVVTVSLHLEVGE